MSQVIEISKKEFNQLSAPEKRILIAKDVIKQIELKRYLAKSGSYIELPYTGKYRTLYNTNLDIKQNFEEIDNCEVCAMGACILSLTKIKNKLNFSDIGGTVTSLNKEKVKSLFNKTFTPRQLLMIETAFEKGTTGDKLGREFYNHRLTLDEIFKCLNYAKKYSSSKSLLIAIMQNIIDNKGMFIP